MKDAKSFEISRQLVMEAYRRVKANRGGAAGVDNISIADFENNLKGNLYRIWNRMGSGSYLPPAVKLVEIPKSNRNWNPNHWVPMELADIAKEINPVIQGWINYYGQHNPRVLKEVLQHVNQKLSRRVRKKFKGLRKRKAEAVHRLGDIALQKPDLFAHWAWGVKPAASKRNRKRK
jgi:hypothetical protein